MLNHLQLRDFVIVDEAELALEPGMTALTGETGAGKSIVVDALLLIAGARAGADLVRQGAQRAEVSALFTALPAAAVAWLESQSIEHEPDSEILVRRIVGSDGRSRAYLNGQLVPLQLLREFADLVLEIHGQQEFQHLVKREAQRELLDANLAEPALLSEVAELYARYRECRRAHDELRAAAANRDARVELLRYNLAEFDAEVTTAPAIEELFAERKRVAGSGRLGAAARSALDAAYDADAGSAHDLLAKAAVALRSVADADAQLLRPAQMLEEATILAQEAAGTLRHYLERLEVDPRRQEEIERRAAALESLARKHRCTVLELPAQRLRLGAELQSLEHAEANLADFQHQLDDLDRRYRSVAGRLTQQRRTAAEGLAASITALMQSLGMTGGRFGVAVEPTAGDPSGPHGVDAIEFLVSANPGQPLRSLAKVASGGELSRISLAIQVAAAAGTGGLCMVFDEVDAGIGGGIAAIVGRQLRALGHASQVLCVTHLAQVAAQAHAQYRVVKTSAAGVTRTLVKRLGAEDRIDEVARMLGGLDVSAQARAHAAEMLSSVAVRPAEGRPKREKKQTR